MGIVKKYPAVIAAVQNAVEGIYTIEIESLDKPFKYEPGQFLHLTVDEYDPAGQWPDSRCFSIQSNQSEKNIKLTFSVKGRYTKKIEQNLIKGCKIWVKLPYGDLFTREHNKENAVFLAGGTGLTPFLSLFCDFSFANYLNPVLYAGFKNRAMNFYFDEIKKAKEINPTFTANFIYENEDGLIDLLDVHKNSGSKSSYFISGPPLMIGSFKETLCNLRIPVNQIHTDDWS